jgi:hypothetical protein
MVKIKLVREMTQVSSDISSSIQEAKFKVMMINGNYLTFKILKVLPHPVEKRKTSFMRAIESLKKLEKKII